MESIEQAQQPTNIQMEKSEAMKDAVEKIETLITESGGKIGKLDAINVLLEGVRGKEGKEYVRLEQVLAKSKEYLEINADAIARRGELERILPGVAEKLAANDERYLVAA